MLAFLAFFFGYRPKRASHEPRPFTVPSDRLGRFVHELAAQDGLVFFYLVIMLVAVLHGEGARRTSALVGLSVDLAVLVTALVLFRGGILRGRLGALVYRVGLFAGVFGSFLQLKNILPTARVARVDADLYGLDKLVFGFEPAEVFDRWVTEGTTEWFSFFYFGYFFVLALHILPFMFAVKKQRLLSEFSFGIIWVFCIGHLLYMVVPGHGPYHYLADRFEHPLEGPFWWKLVKDTVDAVEVSARTDIFPSLHTGAPTYLALFSLRHRREVPFRFAWIPSFAFASQIVISTMFLRWHYLIDVIAGLLLGSTTAFLGGVVAAWEERRRRERGAAEVWTFLW